MRGKWVDKCKLTGVEKVDAQIVRWAQESTNITGEHHFVWQRESAWNWDFFKLILNPEFVLAGKITPKCSTAAFWGK